MSIYVALLRGINVGGRNRVPMKELVQMCEGLGWKEVRTVLQTGNVVFAAPEGSTAEDLESVLERAINEQFQLSIPVVVRNGAQFGQLLDDSPHAEQAAVDPSRALLYLTKQAIASNAEEKIVSRAKAGEVVTAKDGALWIYFPNGIGTSKLTPAVIDRAVGSPATGRNWKTVRKIMEAVSVNA